MEENKEWKEINQQLENREYEIKEKYGFDISKNWLNRIEKQNKIWKIIKVIIILLIILLIGMWHRDIKTRESMMVMKGIGNFDIEIISNKTGIFGNGLYVYRIKNNPEIEIHASRQGNTIENDIESRFYKYFFEKWQDNEKEKFIVKESYKDCKNGLITKKNWLLEYETYIEVNSYEEMEKATEAIIRFNEYMQKPMFLIKSYIKVGEKIIMPHNVYPQTNEQIRENAKRLYMQAVNEK